MNDYVEVANCIARYFAAVDERNWERVAELMTDPFSLDYSSFGAGEPADLAPRTILAGWRKVLPGFDHTHHQMGNLDIEVEGEKASASCYVTATHAIDHEVWTVVGTYNKELVRDGADWKLSGSQFLFKYQSGATHLATEAQRRAAAAG